MDLEINKKNYIKKKISSFTMAIGFLLFSILLSVILYLYNISLVSESNDLNNNITQKEKSISELEKNSQIVILSLYEANSSYIKKIEDYSRISLYIDHLTELSKKYNINFNGFKYSSGKLNTKAISKSDGYGINYKKVVKFIKEYRENKDLSALFDLKLVKNVKSKDDGVFNVFDINLILKSNILNILKKSKLKNLELEKKKEEENRKKEEISKKARENFIKKQKQKSNFGTITK